MIFILAALQGVSYDMYESGAIDTATLTANAFTRTGYQFIGWSTSSDGQVVYTDEASLNVPIPIILYIGDFIFEVWEVLIRSWKAVDNS